MTQKIFIGSSTEALPVCSAVQMELQGEFDVQNWKQGVFKLSRDALDSLLDVLDRSDAGIFVLRGDDLTTSRGEATLSVRDNVLLELGMFIGRLGRDRTFMLTPEGDRPQLPSDLDGITTAVYKDDADEDELADMRVAVSSACLEIRDHLKSGQAHLAAEPEARVRLDRAMGRLSRDLESLLGPSESNLAIPDGQPLSVSARIGTTAVHVELGRIQDYAADGRVVALPANEYFDDECITDVRSSLGAYVNHHFENSRKEFLKEVRVQLRGVPSQRVPRRERLVDDSYGIGQAIYLDRFSTTQPVILVSATTERAAIGLRAEPHFLYAAMQGIVEMMNEKRQYSLATPVLGSGHGGIPLTVALLFNLLALRSCLSGEPRLRMNEVRIVMFDGGETTLTESAVNEVLERVGAQVSLRDHG
jgi:hypothetical protein